MAETNLELFHRWFEDVWNQRREETIDELLNPGAKGHGFGAEPVVGPTQFKPVWRTFLLTFADMRVRVEDAIGSGDVVAGHLTVTGKHVGDGLGIPAQGNEVSFVAHVYTRWRDGQIVEGWNLIDMASLYRQAGIL